MLSFSPKWISLAGWFVYCCLPSCLLAIQAEYENFKLIRTADIPLYGLTLREYQHEGTDAGFLVLIPQQSQVEKTFAISFRTPVEDSRGEYIKYALRDLVLGTPHILEHAVLSGSKKYPVHFPLHHFSKTSMATFVNAMTYPDRTTYPVSTVNGQDLLNLASVYLDGVFDPLVLEDEKIFHREGWHYEYDTTNASLLLSGVVYNEMKGVFSNPKSLSYKANIRALLPNTTYAHVSGGDPDYISDLTHSGLLKFYYDHYHPANAKLYYYGTEEVLPDLMHKCDEYLSMAASRYRNIQSAVPSELPSTSVAVAVMRNETIYTSITVPSSEAVPKDSVLLSLLLGDTEMDQCEKLSLSFMSHLLLGNREAPLYKALEEAKIGASVMNHGFDSHGRHLLFSIGIDGISKSESADIATIAERIEQLFDEKLRDIATSGFDTESINAAKNLFEFSLQEEVANSDDKGITFMDYVYDEWNYDQDPIRGFTVDKACECVTDRVDNDDRFLSKMIEKYLLYNRHRSLTGVVSDTSFDARRAHREKKKNEFQTHRLSHAEHRAIHSLMSWLRDEAQTKDTPEALATLPRLSVEVVPAEATVYPSTISSIENSPVVQFKTSTAKIGFGALYFDLKDLTAEDLKVMSLLRYLLLNGSTKNRGSEEIRKLRDLHCGGLGTSVKVTSVHPPGIVADPTVASAWFDVTFKYLSRSAGECLGLLKELLTEHDFAANKDKASAWMAETLYEKEMQALSSPSRYARTFQESLFSLSGKLVENLSGMSSISMYRNLLERVNGDWEELAAEMDGIWAKIYRRDRLAIRVAGGDATLSKTLDTLSNSIVSEIPPGDNAEPSFDVDRGFQYVQPQWAIDVDFHVNDETIAQSVPVPTLVAFNYLGVQPYPAGSDIPYRHLIPARTLSIDYIFPEIRFSRGAYGAGVSLKLADGRYLFSSYRDPHTTETFVTFLNAADAMDTIAERITGADIEQSIIRAIADIDEPESSSAKSRTVFDDWAMGITREHKQKIRDAIFSTNQSDFAAVASVLRSALESSPKIAVSFSPSKKNRDEDLTEQFTPALPAFKVIDLFSSVNTDEVSGLRRRMAQEQRLNVGRRDYGIQIPGPPRTARLLRRRTQQ